jgi:plastocyanin
MSRGPARRALRPALLLAALLVGVLPAQVAATSVTIHVGDTLSPKSLTVAPGTTVRWVNESDTRHRMRSRNGPVEFDSHNLEPGQSFSFTFTRAGTYPYVDHRDEDDAAFHGTIVVASSGDSGGSGGGGAGEDPAVPNPPSGGGGGAAPASATVHMAGKSFSPSSVTIATGGSVTFLNDDDREHTATGDAFDTGVLNPGSQSRETFGSAGTFSFLCAIHPDMRGTINVRGSSEAAPAPATPGPTPTPTPTVGTPPADGDQVASIVDFAFDPGEVEVPAGSTVTWQNHGEAPHTVTAGDGTFDSGLIAAGATWARTFTTPGTYAFVCQFHPEMVGTVVVSASAPAAASPSASAAPATSPTTPPAPDFAGVDGGVDEPPAAAIPDEGAPAAFREGALRLLVVAGLVAGAVLAFGFLISGTARRRPSHTRR